MQTHTERPKSWVSRLESYKDRLVLAIIVLAYICGGVFFVKNAEGASLFCAVFMVLDIYCGAIFWMINFWDLLIAWEEGKAALKRNGDPPNDDYGLSKEFVPWPPAVIRGGSLVCALVMAVILLCYPVIWFPSLILLGVVMACYGLVVACVEFL